MSMIIYVFLVGLVTGFIAVAANPAPYFAALGLVVASGMACGILVACGGSFLSLVLFLIYLGGMLVVFAYSAALAAEPYPEGWGSWPVAVYAFVYSTAVGAFLVYNWEGWNEYSWMSMDEAGELYVLRGDLGGVALIYSMGGGMLVISAWVLLLTLFVVLELTRGLSRGALRAV
nr:NADH dehydrogenase subunit 6 [Diapterus auratus]